MRSIDPPRLRDTPGDGEPQAAPQVEPPADAAPLPSLLQLDMEAADLDAYLHELAAHAQIEEIRTKHATTAHSSHAATMQPSELADAFRRRSVISAQLLYRLDGELYVDTLLLRTEGPHRLIRRPPTRGA